MGLDMRDAGEYLLKQENVTSRRDGRFNVLRTEEYNGTSPLNNLDMLLYSDGKRNYKIWNVLIDLPSCYYNENVVDLANVRLIPPIKKLFSKINHSDINILHLTSIDFDLRNRIAQEISDQMDGSFGLDYDCNINKHGLIYSKGIESLEDLGETLDFCREYYLQVDSEAYAGKLNAVFKDLKSSIRENSNF